MSVDAKKTCNMHTKEKEKLGTCCQTKSIQQLCVENPTLTYRQEEQLKEKTTSELLKEGFEEEQNE